MKIKGEKCDQTCKILLLYPHSKSSISLHIFDFHVWSILDGWHAYCILDGSGVINQRVPRHCEDFPDGLGELMCWWRDGVETKGWQSWRGIANKQTTWCDSSVRVGENLESGFLEKGRFRLQKWERGSYILVVLGWKYRGRFWIAISRKVFAIWWWSLFLIH